MNQDLQDLNAKIAALETKDPSDTIRMTVEELLLLLRAYRCEIARADALTTTIQRAIIRADSRNIGDAISRGGEYCHD